jgi:SnoaL-like domain
MTTSDHLQAWLDKLALIELLAVLSAAVDRGDREAIIGCYAEESYDDHGAFKGSGREFAEMICAPSGPGHQMTMHHQLGQSVLDVEGDDAWGETFFVMHAVLDGRAGRTMGVLRPVRRLFPAHRRKMEARLPAGGARRDPSRRRRELRDAEW